MKMRFSTPLTECERSALSRLARHERRDPRDQAALIIRRELERLGLIEPEVKHDEPQTA
jgi:hypothetical protein